MKSKSASARSRRSRPVLLTGLPGAGKTVAGRILARMLSLPFLDMDEEYARRWHRSPAATMASRGERLFRKREAEILKEILECGPAVVACGGGTLVSTRNLSLAQKKGVVIWLDAPDDVLARRLGDASRHPLLSGRPLPEALAALRTRRAEAYGRSDIYLDGGRLSPFLAALELYGMLEPFLPRSACTQQRLSRFRRTGGPERETVLLLGQRSYPLRFSNRRSLSGLGQFLVEVLPTRDTFVMVDEYVLKTYAGSIRSGMLPFPCRFIPVPSGEEAKRFDRTEECLERLLLAGATRSSAIVAIGGGSTLDAAGFAASVYMRGIPVVHVPTTLLAAVDASIGGKTAVNLRQARNLAGTFFQPRGVFVPLHIVWDEIRARGGGDGAAELLKTCLLLGLPEESVRAFAPATPGPVLRRSALLEAVALSARFKAEVVSRDEKEESGVRTALNLGHTFAHMVERASDYRISHGRALAWGLVVAARASAALGLAGADLPGRVQDLCTLFGLWPPPLPPPRERLDGPLYDKKQDVATVTLVLLEAPGRPRMVRLAEEEARKLLLSCM